MGKKIGSVKKEDGKKDLRYKMEIKVVVMGQNSVRF